MALSPYRDRDSSVYRSRSSSVSSPTTRNFVYQEVFEIGGNALVRSYSCGQVFTKDRTGQTIQATQVRISNFVSPSKHFSKINVESDRRSWSVPKKLPVVYHGVTKPVKSKMSLQFPDTEKPSKTDYCDNGRTSSSQCSSLISKNMKRTVYLNLIILTIFSAFCIYKYKHCHQHWDTQMIASKLKQSVFGQEMAILKIENVLNKFNSSHDSAILCFTGTAGVGKTFVSSIIYDNFPWISNEYICFFDSNTEQMLSTRRYSSCGVNLIVIDGIDASVAGTAVKSVEHLLDKNANAKFLVILIFRTLTEDEEKFVLDSIENMNQNYYYIPFRNLKQEEIEQCFNAELKRQKKYVTQKKLKELVSEHMKFCNISKSFLGCKKVFHEVSLLPKIN